MYNLSKCLIVTVSQYAITYATLRSVLFSPIYTDLTTDDEHRTPNNIWMVPDEDVII